MTHPSLTDVPEVPYTIQKAHENQRLAHAYLLYGSDRNCLESSALATLEYLMEQGGEKLSERDREKIIKEEHPDVYWIRPEGLAGKIRVEKVLSVLERISLSPSIGASHFVIITEAEKLNRESANTLLKTLEEPVAKVLFLVLAKNPSQVPDTIKSRCQKIRVVAKGGQNLVPELYSVTRDTIVESLIKIRESKDITGLFELSEKLSRDIQGMKKKKNDDAGRRYLHMIVHIVLYWYRDLAMLQCGVREGLVYPDKLETLEKWVVADHGEGGWNVVERLQEFAEKLDSNLNTRLFLDNLFITATQTEER